MATELERPQSAEPVAEWTNEDLFQAMSADRSHPAAKELVARMEIRGKAYLLKFGLLESDIADVLQNAWAKAWSGRSAFRSDSTFAVWFITILRNEAFNLHRSGRRMHVASQNEDLQEMLNETTAEWNVQPINACIEESRDLLLRQTFAHLPHTAKNMMYRADIAEKSYKDIAAEDKTPIGTVRSRLANARRAFAKKAIQAGLFDHM